MSDQDEERKAHDIKIAAQKMPVRVLIDMIDNFLTNTKASRDKPDHDEHLAMLQVACMIFSLRDLDQDYDGAPDWKVWMRDAVEKIRDMKKKEAKAKERKCEDCDDPLVVDTLCPHCFTVFTIHQHVFEAMPSLMPEVDDGCMCTTCFEVSRFMVMDGKLHLRKFNADEQAELEHNRSEIERMRAYITSDMARHPKDEGRIIFKLRK